jgi:hypothetical protein
MLFVLICDYWPDEWIPLTYSRNQKTCCSFMASNDFRMNRVLALTLMVLTITGCNHKSRSGPKVPEADSPELLFRLEQALTEAIIQDGFSPPVASRIYAYCNLTAQSVISLYDENDLGYTQNLNGFGPLKELDHSGTDRDLVLVSAFNTVAKELVYRDHIIDSLSVEIVAEGEQLSDLTKERSIALANEISAHILERAHTDSYKETRLMARYDVKKGKEKWEPTPPAYTDALEPHWAMIKPFTLDSAGQFFVPFRFEYSTESTSEFYQVIAKEVYDSVFAVNDEYIMIAKFWDCNPFLTKQNGHLMYHIRQLTPGGHWIGITESVCRQGKLSLAESVSLLARVSVAMADGFVCAWHCKYKTDFIRPETYINRYMDAEWKPILESPHFPEYTSAHSVVSAAAAHVLTQHFGENYAFTDSSEVPFGLIPRDFDSFFQASDEASLSRVLGGIHFRPAIEVGMEQGRDVGAHAIHVMEGPH